MQTKRNLYSLLTVTLLFALGACQREVSDDIVTPNHTATIQFKPVVDGDALIMGDTYTNTFGEEYAVSTFKYYVHDIKLTNTSTGYTYAADTGYYLVDFADNNYYLLSVEVPAGTYNQLSFTLGVDSIRNVSGAQTGALDPTNGMFWTWNSGYIMAKLEGTAPDATTPNNMIEYHIGGFSGENNVVSTVALSFPDNGAATLTEDGSSIFTVTANTNAWFSGVHDIRITDEPAITTPGALAREVADNYLNMFTITSVVNNP